MDYLCDKNYTTDGFTQPFLTGMCISVRIISRKRYIDISKDSKTNVKSPYILMNIAFHECCYRKVYNKHI